MASDYVLEMGLDDYIGQYINQAGRILLSCVIELTRRCNNRCIHCFINKPCWDPEEKHKELNLKELQQILDDLAELGCLRLLLTGGEPLLREDFREIYLYAKKKGFLVTVFTNGTLITPTLADFFQEYPPRAIEITLYGATKSTYEKVTGIAGSYDNCLRGLRLLLDRSLSVRLKTVIIKANKHEFIPMRDFVQNLGLDFRFDALINARVDGERDVTQLRISPAEVVELDLTDPRRKQEFRRLYDRSAGNRANSGLLYKCGAGLNSVHIDPLGQLSLCTTSRTPSYDLRTGSLAEAWSEFIPDIRKHKVLRPGPCQTCDLSAICNQCPGWAQLESGDPEASVDFLCAVTRLRAEAYGIGMTTQPHFSLSGKVATGSDGN